jgi:hypothetical protein
MKKYLFVLFAILAGFNLKAQDIITKSNGEEIQAKILEISDTEIKYKKFSYQTGPTYTVKKSDVVSIKYPNGDIENYGAATTPSVDTTKIYGIKIEKSQNPNYDIIYFKNGETVEGKVVDITETELSFTNSKGIIKMTAQNSEIEKIALLNSNEAMHQKIKKVHVGFGTKSNQFNGDGKKDDRLIGVKVTGVNTENDMIRKEWKANGGLLNAVSYDGGGSYLYQSFDITNGYMDMNGFGINAAYGNNYYKLKLPEYTGDLQKAPWGTLVYGSGLSFAITFNSTYMSYRYQTVELDPYTYTYETVWVYDYDYSSSTSTTFTLPLNLGYVWARGKYLTAEEWRGNMYGLIYKPSLVWSITDGESFFNVNPFGFGVEFSRGGLQNSLDKITPKAHWRIGGFFMPPLGDMPLILSLTAGITFFKSLKQE